MADPSRDPRSLYLSSAIVDEVRRYAEASRRTYSAQLCHLAELGLTAVPRIDFQERAQMDDCAQRQHFYPDLELDRSIEKLIRDKRLESYSAAARALVSAGLVLVRASKCALCGPSRSMAEAVDRCAR